MSNTAKFSQSFQDEMSPLGESQSILSMSNEFRAIKRIVLQEAFSDPDSMKNRIMITSVHGNAGKTFIAYNLARSIALEKEKTVLLVDCDVTSPSFNKAMEIEGVDSTSGTVLGLIDYLNDVSKGLGDVLLHTDVDNLKVLPCGQHHFLANELLSGANMAQLMSEFQSRYPNRLVILDAPPLLDVNESATLSQYVDQLIVVVEEGVTKSIDLARLSHQIPKDIIVYYLLNRAES